jgi:hypothetical protein
LNRNARIVDAILNKEMLAPKDFERMRCRVSTLNTALQFYRDWIRQAEYLTDLSWFMTCGDHKALVVNIMLNVPHNRNAFRDLFGSDGESLWSDFRRRFAAVFGREFQLQDETDFEPLWKKERLNVEEIRPLSLVQYNAFHAAQAENRLDSFEGPRPLPPGIGMAWPLETLIDLLTGFSATYLPADRVGGVATAAAVLGLSSDASERLNIAESQYRVRVAPLVSRLLIADAMQSGQPQAVWLTEASARFRRILAEALARSHGEAFAHGQACSVTDECFAEVAQQLASPSGSPIAGRAGDPRLQTDQGEVPVGAHPPPANGPPASNAFATPGVFHRIATGAYPCSKFVSVTAVCTVVDQSEIEFVGKAPELAAPNGRQGSSAELPTIDPVPRRDPANDEVANPAPIVAAQSAYPAEIQIPALVPSSTPAVCTTRDAPQLVYALGQVGYDFGSETCRDAFKQRMRQVSAVDTCPQDEHQLFRFLSSQGLTGTWPADSLIWTLGTAATPQYAIRAEGPFARECYERFLHSMGQQFSGEAMWIAVPGTISGQAALLNGRTVPVINPDPAGMCPGTIAGLLRPNGRARSKAATTNASSTLKCFLDRAYQEVQNPGLAPQDRALNFAITKLPECALIRKSLDSRKALDTVRVEQSQARRTDAECWDVHLTLFDPDDPLQRLRQVIRYTVDVSHVVPVSVGAAQSWLTRS